MSPHQEERIVQEEDRLSSRRAITIATGSVVAIMLVLLIVGLLLRASVGEVVYRIAVRSAPAGQVFAPREISGIKQTLISYDRYGLRLQQQQQTQLDEFEWVDRDRGIIAIPIGEAMRLRVEQGP